MSAGQQERLRIHVSCSDPACAARFDVNADTQGEITMECPVCRGTRTVVAAEAVQNGVLVACPCCGGDELYVRKDFPQRLGVALVVLVAAASLWLFARGDLMWAMGVLVGMAVVDLLIYQLVPRITVCYRCGAEFRGLALNPRHAGFDLATAEKYR